jgi:hypothetical protein
MELTIQKFINSKELLVSINSDRFDYSDINKSVDNNGYYLHIHDCGLVRYGYNKCGEFWSSSLSQIKTIFPEYSFFDAEVLVKCGNTTYSGFALLNTDDILRQIAKLGWQRKAGIGWNMQLCEMVIKSYDKHHDQFLKDCKESGFEVISWNYGTYRVGFKKSDLKKFVNFLDKSYVWKWSFQ